MRIRVILPVCVALVVLGSVAPARAEKPLDLGKTKFKEIAKYLNLTAEQETKIKQAGFLYSESRCGC